MVWLHLSDHLSQGGRSFFAGGTESAVRYIYIYIYIHVYEYIYIYIYVYVFLLIVVRIVLLGTVYDFQMNCALLRILDKRQDVSALSGVPQHQSSDTTPQNCEGRQCEGSAVLFQLS